MPQLTTRCPTHGILISKNSWETWCLVDPCLAEYWYIFFSIKNIKTQKDLPGKMFNYMLIIPMRFISIEEDILYTQTFVACPGQVKVG